MLVFATPYTINRVVNELEIRINTDANKELSLAVSNT